MNAISKKDDRARQSVRLQPDLWCAIDIARAKRAGVVSRNTWISEAMLEKLAREQDTLASPSPDGSGHV